MSIQLNTLVRHANRSYCLGSQAMDSSRLAAQRAAYIASAFTLAAFASCLFAVPANAALIGHWKFDETSGGTASDSVNNNDGIWQNGVSTNLTWTTGQMGGAAGMIGGGNDKFITNAISQLNGATAMSWSAWFNVTALADNDGIYSIRNATDSSGTNQYYGVNTNNAQRADGRASGEANAGTTTLATGEWYHVVNVWDGATNTQSIYLNGVLENTRNLSTAAVAITNNPTAYFGDDPCCGGREFNGLLDDFGLFDSVLSQSEVDLIYFKGVNGKSLSDAIPEPSTAVLTLLGLALFGRRRRRDK